LLAPGVRDQATCTQRCHALAMLSIGAVGFVLPLLLSYHQVGPHVAS
jgi:hypothetical protein